MCSNDDLQKVYNDRTSYIVDSFHSISLQRFAEMRQHHWLVVIA